MVPITHGEWLCWHILTARVHLSDEHGHLSPALGSFGEILDELLGASDGGS